MARDRWLWIALLTSLAPAAARAQPSYSNFEAGQVRPLALSPDGTRLYAVNTPDDRLEVFDVGDGRLVHRASVAVGLSPVAVAAESASRVWVVNHLSDSVSIVDVASTPPRVVRTLLVGDEPSDIVFAGTSRERAFITTAHRGQNHPSPRGDYEVEGIGRADVWVFDTASLGAPLGGTPRTIVRLFGDRPRALAASADGRRVYAAVFYSGNRTTVINEGLVCNGGPSAAPCRAGDADVPGGLPGPMTNHAGVRAPEVGLIVRQDAQRRWLDELGRDWSDAVRFELPDYDVFEIDATAAMPASTRSIAGVGTVLFAMAINPRTGALYVANTEAFNEVRFEGPGRYVREQGLPAGRAASVRGHLHEARVTVIDAAGVRPRHLNPHIAYDAATQPPGTRDRTLAQPVAIAVSADGETVYVAAYGSSAIGVLDADALAGSAPLDTSLDRRIALSSGGPVGPSGLVLDEARGRLYVLTRFDNSVVAVDLGSRAVAARARMHTPEPASTIVGRPMLYDARFTSTNGEASCGSCHVFGDFDGLAWDLGDPDGDVLPNPNPRGPIGGGAPFHPMKGPMTTQTLRGMPDHGPLHWRGDRTAGHRAGGDPLDERASFEEFNAAFGGLLGREEGPLRDEEMRRFAEFALGMTTPPNPIRQLDNTLRADEERGRQIYFERNAVDAITTCNGCHVLDRARGFFGGDGRTTFENETQEFKVPQLRNAYQKVGMFGMAEVPFFDPGDNGPTGPQVRGFGFMHDGSCDTLERFMHASVFTLDAADARDVAAFVMAFDNALAPVVGQQVTLSAGGDAATEARIDLLIARARTTSVWPGGATTRECDLVARTAERGYLLRPADGRFQSDRAGETTSDAELRAVGRLSAVTYTCAPPGSGVRMALDRDEDGTYDGDELDRGTNPAERVFVEIPNPRLPGEREDLDAGVPDLDGGVDRDGGDDRDAADARTPIDSNVPDACACPPPPDSGCACRANGRPSSHRFAWLGAALVAFVLFRRRR